MIEKVIVYYLHQEKTTFAKIVVVISGKLPFTVDFKMKQRVPLQRCFFFGHPLLNNTCWPLIYATVVF